MIMMTLIWYTEDSMYQEQCETHYQGDDKDLDDTHLVHRGVELAPEVEGHVEQQEEQVRQAQRGQEQARVVARVTLSP